MSLSSGITLYVGGSGPGNYTSIQEAINDEKNEDFTGTIRLENKENSEDYCMIDVSLSTPMNKQSKNMQVFQFIQELRQRYLISR